MLLPLISMYGTQFERLGQFQNLQSSSFFTTSEILGPWAGKCRVDNRVTSLVSSLFTSFCLEAFQLAAKDPSLVNLELRFAKQSCNRSNVNGSPSNYLAMKVTLIQTSHAPEVCEGRTKLCEGYWALVIQFWTSPVCWGNKATTPKIKNLRSIPECSKSFVWDGFNDTVHRLVLSSD